MSVKYFITFVISMIVLLIGIAWPYGPDNSSGILVFLFIYLFVFTLFFLLFILKDRSVYNILKNCKKIYIELHAGPEPLISQSDIESYYSVLPKEMKAENKDEAEIVIEITPVNTYGSRTESDGAYIYTYNDVPENHVYLDFIYMKTSKIVRRLKINSGGHIIPHKGVKKYLEYSFKAENFFYFIVPKEKLLGKSLY